MLTGSKGSGKGAAAVGLSRLLRERGLCPYVVDFATPLRKAVCAAFDIPMEDTVDRVKKEQPIDHWPFLSPRHLLQFVGTDMFRAQWPEVWVKAWGREAGRILAQSPHNVVICADCRFVNEAEAGRYLDNCVVVRITRREAEAAAGNHASETSFYEITPDWILSNDSSLLAFMASVAAMADEIF